MSDELAAGVRRMLADADQRGLAVELRRRPVAHSLEEAAELLGIAPSDMAKTIVVRRSSGDYLFAVIPGNTQISWPKLRLLLGVSKMKLPDAAEALQATGYERGTITPIGSHPSWPVIIDRRLVGHRAALAPVGMATAPSSRSTILSARTMPQWPTSSTSGTSAGRPFEARLYQRPLIHSALCGSRER
jgi:Cys-tRNA(Pro)/Cys-tRNA(Cys) deacylase